MGDGEENKDWVEACVRWVGVGRRDGRLDDDGLEDWTDVEPVECDGGWKVDWVPVGTTSEGDLEEITLCVSCLEEFGWGR